MDTEVIVTHYLILNNVSEDMFLGIIPRLNWIDATDHTGGLYQVTDVDSDGELHEDVDFFSVGTNTEFTSFYIKFNDDDTQRYAVYYDSDNDVYYVPHNGDLTNEFPSGGDPYNTTSSGSPIVDKIVCFIAGTSILTAELESVPVESLRVGQELLVSSGESRKIKFIFKQRIRDTKLYFDQSAVMPVRILQGALGADSPSSDLLVSPSHALLIDGNLVEAHALINGSSIYQETSWDGELEYYHIELEDHSVIYANNVPAETFIDNVSRATFDNYDEYLALYSEAEDMQELEYPRAKSSRQLPKALKQKLVDRAEILYPELVIKKVA